MGAYELRVLFERHHVALFRFFLRMTGDRALAEDLLQETFLRAARRGPTGRRSGSARAWLYAVARNLLADRERRRRTRVEPVPLDAARLTTARGNPERSLGLGRALQSVPGAEREAFLLREVGGLGYREIVAVQGGTEDAVRNRIYRARKLLRDLLRDEKEGRGQPAREM